MEKVRLGIIGLGNMGSSHAKKITAGEAGDEIILTAVCDIKPEKLEWAKAEFGDAVARFDDAEAMMDSGLVDAICVAVPHYDHPTYAIMAMKKGLHVMIEKPAGVYTEQVLEMNKVADECNVTFAIMMNQRTNCLYRKMREIIKSGELGEIRRTSWIITNWYRPQAYYDSGDWRATWSGEGGGVLLNQCPHNLDLWQWICGMPEKISAKLHFGKWHDIEVEDDVTAYVEYANGATGTFITTTGDFPGTNRFEVTLEKGKIIAINEKDGTSLTMWKTSVSEPEFSATNKIPFGHPEMVKSDVETDGQNPQHMGVFRAFAANILHGTPLVADGREGINGLTISNAMHLSAWTDSDIEVKSFDHAKYKELILEKAKNSRRKAAVNTSTVSNMDSTF
ncbi:MAG: Gfo/Idh/MocA family oxidoreductase [Ruminococcaceae bacterium]|nr:Gfo/Idh/MocA family oxidoreductase [Oscillospiraceae bacterium]